MLLGIVRGGQLTIFVQNAQGGGPGGGLLVTCPQCGGVREWKPERNSSSRVNICEADG
jgi:hypothetical protein